MKGRQLMAGRVDVERKDKGRKVDLRPRRWLGDSWGDERFGWMDEQKKEETRGGGGGGLMAIKPRGESRGWRMDGFKE
jgi:hypothetical protein